MLVRDMLLDEGGSDEQFLAVLAPVFSFTLLSDVRLCGEHEFPVIGTLQFIRKHDRSYEWTHSC